MDEELRRDKGQKLSCMSLSYLPDNLPAYSMAHEGAQAIS